MAIPPIAILAENNGTIRNFLRIELANRGFTVMQCFSGAELVDCAASHLARVVLLSVDLRDEEATEGYAGHPGFRACVRLRALPDYAKVPILLMYLEPMSASVREREVTRLRAAAASAKATRLMRKPISANDLYDALRAHVIGETGRSYAGADASAYGISEPTARIWEPAGLVGARRGAEDFLSKGAEALARLRDQDARVSRAASADVPALKHPRGPTRALAGR